MKKLSRIAISKAAQKDPRIVASLIRKTGKEIEKSKGSIKDLKDRGVLNRMFSNNTRDISEILVKQNTTQAAFLDLLEGIISLSVYNAAFLAKVSESIKMTEKGRERDLSEYESIAVSFLDATIERQNDVHKKISSNADELERLKQEVLDKTRLDVEQSATIDKIRERQKSIGSDISKYRKAQTSIDEVQSQRIEALQKILDKHKNENTDFLSELSNEISNLNVRVSQFINEKSQLDKEQSDLIESFTEHIEQLSKEQSDMFRQISSHQTRATRYSRRSRQYLTLIGIIVVIEIAYHISEKLAIFSW